MNDIKILKTQFMQNKDGELLSLQEWLLARGEERKVVIVSYHHKAEFMKAKEANRETELIEQMWNNPDKFGAEHYQDK